MYFRMTVSLGSKLHSSIQCRYSSRTGTRSVGLYNYLISTNSERRQNVKKKDANYINANIASLLKQLPKMNDRLQKPAATKGKKAQKKYPAAHVSLQVIGTGAPGAPASLYVFAGQTSYMFNCGEGTQRLAHEHRTKLSTLEHVLVTHKTWRNVGGLPGMLLTLQGSGTENLTLHGPPGVHVLYKDTKSFVLFDQLNLSYHHYGANNGVLGKADDALTIRSVPIRPRTEGATAQQPDQHLEFVVFGNGGSDSPRSLDSSNGEEQRGSKRHASPVRGSSSPELTGSDGEGAGRPVTGKRSKTDEFTTDMSMAYICKLPPKLGQLLPHLCVKARVPPGPLLGELKAGRDVTLQDGTVVRACDVTLPDDHGPLFIVVDAPTLPHMHSLVQHPAFAPHQVAGSSDVAQVVVHFTPDSLVQSCEYQSWLQKFPAETHHMFINESNTCTGSIAQHRMQQKLRHLDTVLFPALADTSIPDEGAVNGTAGKMPIERSISTTVGAALGKMDLLPETPDTEETVQSNTPSISKEPLTSEKAGAAQQGNCVKGVTMLQYHLRPNTKLDRTLCPVINRAAIREEIEVTGCVPQEPPLVNAEDAAHQYPITTFLGTGSCIPNKTRNVSGILLQISPSNYLIMDCGEGTAGQLLRLLGPAGAADVASKLSGIYVSHKHADHHVGLIGLLQLRRRALQDRGLKVTPLPLLAPHKICPYLESYDRHFETISGDYEFVNNELLLDNGNYSAAQREALCRRLAVKNVRTCFVPHCSYAYGVSVTTTDGHTVVYSGDTMPCTTLIELGRDCDLLIHEATLEDSLEHEAVSKKHCTISDALNVAKEMRAKRVLLTHFSQRYAKVAMPLPDSCENRSNVAFAFDNMTVSLSNVPRAAALYPSLLQMFDDYVQEIACKTLKKQMDREREQAVLLDLQQSS